MTKASYRNFTRAFLFKKALRKYSKKYGSLSILQANILYAFAINDAQNKFVEVSVVDQLLTHCGHGASSERLYDVCRELCTRGFLITVDLKPLRYKVSVQGMNTLNLIETTARKERYDR